MLERELYAAPHAGDEFIEVPRWVRRLRAGLATGLPGLDRRHALASEALAMGLGVVFLLVSLGLTSSLAGTTLRLAGALCLVCGYVVSVASRLVDAYQGWQPSDGIAPGAAAPARSRPTPGQRLVFYVAALTLAALFLGVVLRIAG